MELKKRNKFFVLLLLIFLTIIAMYIPYKQALVFVLPERDEIVCYVPMSAGDTFKIKYTHSIHLTDVIESYQITKHNEIRQYELEYEDFAIGMPSEAAKGEHFEMKNGKYYIKNMNRTFENFLLRVGKVRANHTFIQGDVSFPLSGAIEPGARVRIQVKKINFIQQMEGVNILEHKT
ncbi:DUF1850 domain-containing protein [Bacillus sp. JJ1122]|uniref:DUF1850 domain-containing protein n=1 Tax=Bacillus sp. JJ1122 TaxID=3122951 RepID=UPI0030009635